MFIPNTSDEEIIRQAYIPKYNSGRIRILLLVSAENKD